MLPLNKMAKEIKCYLQNKMHRTLQGCKLSNTQVSEGSGGQRRKAGWVVVGGCNQDQ